MCTPATHTLTAGDLSAVFRPTQGMVCVSLTHRGQPLVRLGDEADEAAPSGRAVGIPLLYPWANRLRGTRYEALGRKVELDPTSPWLLTDWNGTLLHGVPWSRLRWQVTDADTQRLAARLAWDSPELLHVFPFHHDVQMLATLDAVGLTLATEIVASGNDRVPVSFGFHPYLGLPGVPREQWQLSLPAMQSLVLDELLIPVGRRTSFNAFDGPLSTLAFDDGFAFESERPTMAITGGGRRIAVEFLQGYRFAQIYAQPGLDYICLEPMTAPANALVTGEQLPLVEIGERFRAKFRIAVCDTGEGAPPRSI
jgi:aldose 1-epimerase